MSMATQVPRYTAAEVRAFPDDRVRYEVIRGELFVTPAPRRSHQRAVREFVIRLHGYLTALHLGEALPAPFEVEFAEDSAVQPDVIVILERDRPKISDERLGGPPALIVEIVSHSSRRTDRLQKRALYQDFGVPDYWIVDIDQRHVEVWESGSLAPRVVTDTLTWQPDRAITPLEIDLRTLFEIVDA